MTPLDITCKKIVSKPKPAFEPGWDYPSSRSSKTRAAPERPESDSVKNGSWKTARERKCPSAPLMRCIKEGILTNPLPIVTSDLIDEISDNPFYYTDIAHNPPCIIDYGCGRGGDVQFMRNNLGWTAFGWAPYFSGFPKNELDCLRPNTVLCTYVMNVIESPADRQDILDDIYSLLSYREKPYSSIDYGSPSGPNPWQTRKAIITVRNDLAGEGLTGSGTWQSNLPDFEEELKNGYGARPMEFDLAFESSSYRIYLGTLPAK